MDYYIEQYKCYLQDLGNIGVRNENSRRFYLSVVSALFVFLSMAGPGGLFQVVQGSVLVLVGIFGVILVVIWGMHMLSFGAVFLAKFDVLRELEKKKNLFPLYDEEWKNLKANPHFKRFTLIDSLTPVLFALLFIVLLFLK